MPPKRKGRKTATKSRRAARKRTNSKHAELQEAANLRAIELAAEAVQIHAAIFKFEDDGEAGFEEYAKTTKISISPKEINREIESERHIIGRVLESLGENILDRVEEDFGLEFGVGEAERERRNKELLEGVKGCALIFKDHGSMGSGWYPFNMTNLRIVVDYLARREKEERNFEREDGFLLRLKVFLWKKGEGVAARKLLSQGGVPSRPPQRPPRFVVTKGLWPRYATVTSRAPSPSESGSDGEA